MNVQGVDNHPEEDEKYANRQSNRNVLLLPTLNTGIFLKVAFSIIIIVSTFEEGKALRNNGGVIEVNDDKGSRTDFIPQIIFIAELA